MRYLAPEKVNLGDTLPVAAVDARSVVPVSDEIGEVVIYIGGRPRLLRAERRVVRRGSGVSASGPRNAASQ